jgi:iron complex transport system substrate-binding protein
MVNRCTLPILTFGLALSLALSTGLSHTAQAQNLSTTTPAAGADPAKPTKPTSKLPARVKSIGDGVVEVTDVSRIIALNGDVNEIIYALGLGDNIIANDITSYYPAEAARKQKIGYGRQLSAEGILALKPTLIIGNQDAGPPSTLAQLRSAGATIVIIPAGDSVYDSAKKIRLVGEALGLSSAGNALADKTYTGIKAVQKKWLTTTNRWEPRAVFFYIRGPRTLLLGGSGTRAAAMFEGAGVTDGAAFSAGVQGYVPITSEALVVAKPDVIVVLTEGLKSVGGIDGILKIPGVSLTPAGQNKRIVDFDDLELLELGPRTPQALEALIAALYKK